MIAPPNKEDISKYWNLLSDDDKKEYLTLFYTIRQNINNPKAKKKRTISFSETVDLIRKYSVRENQSDAVRSIVCGIFWVDDKVAVNSHRLGFLMSRCKSSINGSLQMLGYKEINSKKETMDIISQKLSSITNDRSEFRKWTIRVKSKSDDQGLPEDKTIKNSKIIHEPPPIKILQKPPIPENTIVESHLISLAPIESAEHHENDPSFFKENIILYEVFQSINENSKNENKLQNKDLFTTDVFFC